MWCMCVVPFYHDTIVVPAANQQLKYLAQQHLCAVPLRDLATRHRLPVAVLARLVAPLVLVCPSPVAIGIRETVAAHITLSAVSVPAVPFATRDICNSRPICAYMHSLQIDTTA